MDYVEYQERCDPEILLKWLSRYISHEHLGYDIKKVSLEKFLAVAPDVYVLAAMLRSALMVAAEQKEMGKLGKQEGSYLKPYADLTEEEKISQLPERKAYMAGVRAGRDMALIEMANRITYAAREQLNQYRLENPEYDPDSVVDEAALPELD